MSCPSRLHARETFICNQLLARLRKKPAQHVGRSQMHALGDVLHSRCCHGRINALLANNQQGQGDGSGTSEPGSKPRRPRRHATGLQSADANQPKPRVKGSSKAKQPTIRSAKASSRLANSDDSLVQHLVGSTGLPVSVAKRLVTARVSYPGIPAIASKLQDRVQLLQQLLGPDRAAAAIQRCPNITASSPESLALHLQQWLDFFAPASSTSASSDARRAALLWRLSACPQLLAVDVERLVANLYEVGAIVQAEDLHSYAYKAMYLALAQPEALHEKMRALLKFLNPSSQQQQPTDGVVPGKAGASVSFTINQLQQAARRDHRWLALSSDKLQQRLTGLQQCLQVPAAVVGHIFLLQPSIVLKSTALLASRGAVLQGLPGLDPSKALAAIQAFPALLNLRSEIVQDRWTQLQRATATCPSWQPQLAAIPGSGLAALLVRSQQRYDRLKHVVDTGQQQMVTLQYLMRMSDQAFAAKFCVERCTDEV